MFGYVLINEKSLTPEAHARYQASYCGLCRRLGKRHGLSGRFFLTYDLTFLDILLCSLYEGETEPLRETRRCPAHPLKPPLQVSDAPTDYCADLSIALHYYAALDKWHDDKKVSGLAISGLLKGRLPEIEQKWPAQCESMQSELAKLAELEAQNCQQPDLPADCFGRLMAALFDYKQDRWSEELRAIGYHLGRYIYLLDAADDLKKDEKHGSYNPLKEFSARDGWQETLHAALEAEMAACTAAFERLPCVQDTDVLRNILYSGVWLRCPCCSENTAEDAEKTAQNGGETTAGN